MNLEFFKYYEIEPLRHFSGKMNKKIVMKNEIDE